MIKNQALGGRTNRALILLGLFLGLVSAALVVVYLSKANDSGGGNVSGGAVTPVVVASQGIPAGTRVTADMVTLKSISSDAILPDVFRKTKDVVGQVTRVPLVSGEQVIPSKVTPTGAAIADVENPPLAYVIPEGMRAVSVEVSSVIGASGLIRPGDYVDVILTVQVQGGAAGQSAGQSTSTRDQLARTVLQNALVLSIDQSVARPGAGGSDTSSPPAQDGTSNADASTVTLAVSPVHGEVLTVAETCGKSFGGRLALALRPFGESGLVDSRSQWADGGAPPTCAALLGLKSLQ
ncbi:MAG: Flp pilus assembly protein CpaB [Dehalococcoidia bacterium]|nr:Flp pilus assembly protein CpaB [Dehalococcoidia bacterium]